MGSLRQGNDLTMGVPGKSDLTAVWCVDATLDAERAVRRLMQPFWGVMLVV